MAVKVTKNNDIKRLTQITQTMLQYLENAIELSNSGELEEIEESAEKYSKIFGAKSSYISILIDLSGLVMKLRAAEALYNPEDKKESANLKLNTKDMLLVKEFLRRQKVTKKKIAKN